MAKNSEELLAEQKEAIAEVHKQIEKCRKSHSKTLMLGEFYDLNVFPREIRQLTWLTRLYVRSVGIKTLPDWIGELENLKVLDISGNNKIKKLPDSIVKLKKLKKLNLSGTGLKILPSFLGNLASLKYLEISPSDFKILPQCILDLPKLKRINTRDCNISHLPSLVSKLHELDMKECLRRIKFCKKNISKELDLSYLYIGELPKELSDLYWLEELILVYNNLKSLPEWIGNFSKLVELDLRENKLTSLPNSIGNLTKLKKIYLCFNQLKTIPETFGNLISLEEFFLMERSNIPFTEQLFGQESWFTHLPESFGNLSSLKEFYISDTKLSKLPNSFGNLKSLRELTITGNIAKEFYFPKTMKNLRNLRCVTLRYFDKFPEWIINIKNLVELDISGRDIDVDIKIFKKLPKLKMINKHYYTFNAEDSKEKKNAKL
jgi:Leucine-rich repeat (LRR) protein